MHDRLLPVLVVEDSPEDFEATRRALGKAGLANPLIHCATGDQALELLLGSAQGQAGSRPTPGLILLDLNLPGTDGREVLVRIKADPILKMVPVVVLTTSRDERDVSACYRAGANSYIQKPVDLAGFNRAVATLRDYWLGIVVLPHPA